MKIVMLGTGYVGLVTGACFSEFGYEVICVDKDNKKINNLENGILPIYEPGLETLVCKNFKNGKLLISPEEIFIKSTFSVFRNFRLSSSKGVAKKFIFFFFAYLYKSLKSEKLSLYLSKS